MSKISLKLLGCATVLMMVSCGPKKGIITTKKEQKQHKKDTDKKTKKKWPQEQKNTDKKTKKK